MAGLTEAAVRMPNSAMPAAIAANSPGKLAPIQKTSAAPPPTATTNRVKPAKKGRIILPAPCEAK
jgi:hypothetical protein